MIQFEITDSCGKGSLVLSLSNARELMNKLEYLIEEAEDHKENQLANIKIDNRATYLIVNPHLDRIKEEEDKKFLEMEKKSRKGRFYGAY